MESSTYLKETEIRHILIWMPNWIGDVVFALPSVQALRKYFPSARITVVVRPPSDDFLKNHPDIDSVIRLPFGKSPGILAPLRFAWGLRKYHFDLAIVFPNSTRSAFLTYLSGAAARVGYNTENRSVWLTDAVPVTFDSKKIHGVDYYFKLIATLGVPPGERTFSPVVTRDDQQSQGKLLARLGIQKKDLLIAVSPGASKPEKRWHVERFGILCQRLAKEKNAKILLLGSRAEENLIRKIEECCPKENVLSLLGLNLQVVLGILKNCRLLVANDSGIMNLAALVETPVVAIFGPGHPSTTDPCLPPEKKELVTQNYPCSPCRHNFFKECDPSPHQKPYCIEDISVIDVAEAVDRLLERTG